MMICHLRPSISTPLSCGCGIAGIPECKVLTNPKGKGQEVGAAEVNKKKAAAIQLRD